LNTNDNRRVYRASQLANSYATPTRPAGRGLLDISPPTLWRWVRIGHMPKPFKLGPHTTVWDATEIDAFLADRRAA